MDELREVLRPIAVWLRSAIGWLVLAVFAGTVLALHRGERGIHAWLAVLVKSGFIAIIFGPIVGATEWGEPTKAGIVALCVYGQDKLFQLADDFWDAVGAQKTTVARAVVRWLAGRYLGPAAAAPPVHRDEDRP